jgi:cytochrome c553
MNVRMAIAVLAAAAMTSLAFAEEAKSPQAAQPDPAKGREKATQVCGACHGLDGNSLIPQNPSLAGQGADYIYKQLMNFKGLPKKDEARNNAVMGAMVATLTEQDMRDVAAYFSMQTPAGRAAMNKASLELGQSIWRGGVAERGIPACAGCHSPNGAGIPATFPRLAGQSPDYTDAQLKAWRSGERANDPNKMMRMGAANLNDREIAALADYIAGLH